MPPELIALVVTVLSIGVVHTLLGPDHYLPFVFMARARGWSRAKMLKVTLACGGGHVLGSVVLGLVGIGLGVAVGRLEAIESLRGELAAWALIGFGFVYFVWGLRQAIRNRPHAHVHVHADGTVHSHPHVHERDHLHVHETVEPRGASGSQSGAPQAGNSQLGDSHPADPHRGASPVGAPPAGSATRLTPWVLFTIFVFGPCEPLIPLMMYPALVHGPAAVLLVIVLYGFATLLTMSAMVLAFHAGVGRVRFAGLERHAHAVAGAMVMSCGIAIKVAGL